MANLLHFNTENYLQIKCVPNMLKSKRFPVSSSDNISPHSLEHKTGNFRNDGIRQSYVLQFVFPCRKNVFMLMRRS